MKTESTVARAVAAPIVRLLGVSEEAVPENAVPRARAFAAPLLQGRALPTGEAVLAHADGTASILASIGAAPALCAAAYLVYAADQLGKPDEVLTPLFGASQAELVAHARKLGELQRTAQAAALDAAERSRQVERVRKMLLAFSRDLRVVLLRLASRLQTLRFHAASKRPCPPSLALETLQVFAPLANRLGIWQIKWELEDLSFRFSDPENYRAIASMLDERRADRETRVEALRAVLGADLSAHGLPAEVHGRPKHLYSIWKKMARKRLDFSGVMDVSALRVIVPDVAGCYAVLGRVHERYRAIPGELDDYIARPKANGYRSLHTVVLGDDGRPVEIQIRTREMHEHAEFGIAAHWAYKEAPVGVAATASGAFEARVAQARLVVLRQLLAWERDLAADAAPGEGPAAQGLFDDRIYVFTPQAQVVELAAGATPIDFAYAVHTDLGHRCRGAKVDGVMVPLGTRLQSGQVVEITAAKTGGPSLDWLNPELGYLQSARSKAKVRAWFNALTLESTIARGREAVEKLLQREGRTALKQGDLAAQLGFRSADALFEVVGKDELSLRSIEALLRPAPEKKPDDDEIVLKRSRAPGAGGGTAGGVLVVGVESLLTSLARCCRPAPPDAIAGYVTRGRGVAVHRASCSNLRELSGRAPERVIPVAWGAGDASRLTLYPVDVNVEATDRQGLLRDVSEVFAKEKMNVTGVHTQSVRDGGAGTAFMTFTVEVSDATRLAAALTQVLRVPGVRSARRR